MKILCKYLKNQLNLNDDTYELIYYGLFVLLTNTVSILSVLLIGIILNEWIKTIIFLISFIPLRLYIGGYHASTPLKCYIYFNIFITIFIFLFKININSLFLLIATYIMLISAFFELLNKSIEENKSKLIVILIYLILITLMINTTYIDVILLSTIANIFLFKFVFIKETLLKKFL